MRLVRIISVGLVFFSCFGVANQVIASGPGEPPEVVDTVVLPDVVVTTTRRNKEPLQDSVRSADVVDEAALEEIQAQNAADTMEEMTGVFVQRTNRGAGAPILRGLIGPQNLILVDGVRYNTSTFRTGPNQYLSLIDPFAIQRIEVVRGPSSVLYGNGAMGGVMQIFTHKPPRKGNAIGGQTDVRFASADLSPAASGRVWGTVGDVSYLAGGSYLHYGSLRTGGGATVPLSSYRMAGWRTRLEYRPTPALSIRLNYLGSLVDEAGRVDQLGKGDVRQYDNLDHLAWLRFQYDGKGLLSRVRATLSYHGLTEHIDRHTCALNGVGDGLDNPDQCIALNEETITKKRRYDDVVDVLGGDVHALFTIWEGRVRLTLGGDVAHDWVGSKRADAKSDAFVFESKDRGNFSEGSTYLTAGAYLHTATQVVDFGPGMGELNVLVGSRYSHFSARAPEVPGLGNVAYSYSGAIGSGSIQWLRPGKTNLYVSFSQGFRAPNLQESTVLGDTGSKFEIPNDDLLPERSDTLEAGFKASVSDFSVSAAWFMSWLKDVIDEAPAEWEGQTDVDGKPVIQRVNTARGRFHGAEGAIQWRLWRFTLAANAAWILGDLTNSDDETVPARRVPPLSGMGSLRYTDVDRGWFILGGVRWALAQDRLHPSDKNDLRICGVDSYSKTLADPCSGTDGWVALHARAGWRPTDWARLQLSVNNVLDTSYRTHGSGTDAAGVDVRLTATLQF